MYLFPFIHVQVPITSIGTNREPQSKAETHTLQPSWLHSAGHMWSALKEFVDKMEKAKSTSGATFTATETLDKVGSIVHVEALYLEEWW